MSSFYVMAVYGSGFGLDITDVILNFFQYELQSSLKLESH